jgi:hypothetical protein
MGAHGSGSCRDASNSGKRLSEKKGSNKVAEQVGNRVLGTVKAMKGICTAGHRWDQVELSGYSSGGLCGFLCHDIFPYIVMLQFGGGFPPD